MRSGSPTCAPRLSSSIIPELRAASFCAPTVTRFGKTFRRFLTVCSSATGMRTSPCLCLSPKAFFRKKRIMLRVSPLSAHGLRSAAARSFRSVCASARRRRRCSAIIGATLFIRGVICPCFITSGAPCSAGRKRPVRSCAAVSFSGRRGILSTPPRQKLVRRLCTSSRSMLTSARIIWPCLLSAATRPIRRSLPVLSTPTPSSV